MNDRTKRILMLVAFIASVIAIGIALYMTFFRIADSDEFTQPTVSEDEATAGGLLPSIDGSPDVFTEDPSSPTGLVEADEVAQGDVTATTSLTAGAVKNVALSNDGDGINYYDDTDNRFYRINEEGELERLSEKQFPDVEKATWNKDSEKAILEFPDGSNVVYDFERETQVTLPKHWEDFDFSPTRDQFAAKSIGLDPGNRWLVSSNSDGSNVKSLAALGENGDKVEVNWSPNDQVIGFADTNKTSLGALDRKMIFPVGKNQENFKGLIIEGFGFQSNWSPTGKDLLYSASGSYSNNKPLLWIVDGTSATMGENRRSLGLNTWAEKCTWSSAKTMYCAVPTNLPPNAGLQPALYDDLPDTLYQVDVTTGKSSLVAIPENGQTMSNLFVSKDQSKLYFTDAETGTLELIKLK